jgi:hypothetical protein
VQVIRSSNSDIYQDYLDNAATYTAVLQKAVAAGIDREEITFDNVHVASVTRVDASPNSRLSPAAEVAAPLATSAMRVRYTLLAYGGTVRSSALAEVLRAAVSSGAFDIALQHIALSEGTAGLTSATSDDVAVSALSGGTGDDDQDDAGDDNGGGEQQGFSGASGTAAWLSGGVVVGIAAAAVALVLTMVALALLWWFAVRKPGESNSAVPSTRTEIAVAKTIDADLADSTSCALEKAVAVSIPPASAPPLRSRGSQSQESLVQHAVAYHV